MNDKNDYKYDVFLSFSDADKDWVSKFIIPNLEASNISYIDQYHLELGRPTLDEVENAIVNSRKTILIISPDYLKNSWTQFDSLLVATYGRNINEWRAIPIIIKPCEIPNHLSALVFLDMTKGKDEAWRRLHLSLKEQRQDSSYNLTNRNLNVFTNKISSFKHLIYTRIEEEFSPEKRSGFQVVYHSDGLTSTQIELIVKRIQVFNPLKKKIVRWQYFRIDDNFVISQTTEFEETPKIVDRYKRRGAFISHCLMINEKEFALANYNPFYILNNYHFIDDIHEFITQFNQSEYREPECEVSIDNLSIGDESKAWALELDKLYGLAKVLNNKKNSHALFFGPEKEIKDTLKVVFGLAPNKIRRNMSFDTTLMHQNSFSFFKIVGTPQLLTSVQYKVDTTSHKVLEFILDEDNDLYQKWLSSISTNVDRVELLPSMQELNEAFLQARVINKDYFNFDALEEFGKFFSDLLKERLKQTLAKETTPKIGAQLSDFLLRRDATIEIYDTAASLNITRTVLIKFIQDWSVQPNFLQGLSKSDLIVIERLAEEAQEDVLLFWISTINGNIAHQKVILNKLDQEHYKIALIHFLNPIDPASYVPSQHYPLLLDIAASKLDNIPDQQFVRLINSLVKNDQILGMELLTDRVFSLNKSSLFNIERITKNVNGIPYEFKNAINICKNRFIGSNSSHQFFFRRIKVVICPHCWEQIRYLKGISNCPRCKKVIPNLYVSFFEDCSPCFMQLIGLSGTGKTCYLQALTLALFQLVNKWENYYCSVVSQETFEFTQKARRSITSGRMPPATQLSLHDPYILLLANMKRWGGRLLSVRDVAGELFNRFTFPIDMNPYFLNARTILLMISLDDLKREEYHPVDEVLQSMINTYSQYIPNSNETGLRCMVVVLSKSDLILDTLPSRVREYLISDVLFDRSVGINSYESSYSYMNNYMDNLKVISSDLKEWFDHEEGGRNLIRLAQANNFQLEFTVISSGSFSQAGQDGYDFVFDPKRVLDPLFWILDFESRFYK